MAEYYQINDLESVLTLSVKKTCQGKYMMGKQIRLLLTKEFNTVSKIHKQRNNIHLDNSQIKKKCIYKGN